jgi:hypothetical protein
MQAVNDLPKFNRPYGTIGCTTTRTAFFLRSQIRDDILPALKPYGNWSESHVRIDFPST